MLNALYRRSFSSKVLHVGQMCMRGFKFSYQADADEIHYFGGSDKIADSQSLFLSEHQRLLQGWQQNKCKGGLEVSQIRSLFQAAIGLGNAKAPGVTDKLLQLVMSLYRAQETLTDRLKFLDVICADFGVQDAAVERAVQSYLKTQGLVSLDPEASLAAYKKLRAASRPVYSSLFVPISNQPGGIKFLSDLRADVLTASTAANRDSNTPHLRALSEALKESLAEWFSVGLLQLEQITWDSTPASLLDKVMQSEQVHPYSQHDPWGDLKGRLSGQRRCFGFFHGSMPEEPLVVLHTAIMPTITSSLNAIIGKAAQHCSTKEAKAAIFYSINSTQKGLAGIDLGNFLIKQAAQKLLQEFPGLEYLSTLSPIPKFSKWLITSLDQSLLEPHNPLATSIFASLDDEQVQTLTNAWKGARGGLEPSNVSRLASFEGEVMRRLNSSAEAEAIWKPMLLKLVTRYLLIEKRRKYALDPVANFHLRNGAEVFQINWKHHRQSFRVVLTKQIAQINVHLQGCDKAESFGIMVNYRYRLENITTNNQAYIHHGKIAVSGMLYPSAQALQSLIQNS